MKRPIALSVLKRLLNRDDRDEVLGDLEEGFKKRRDRNGRFAASLWLWRQVISVPLKLAFDRFTAGRRVDTKRDRTPSLTPTGRRWPGGESQVLDHTLRDIRFTLRSIRKRPLFFVVPVLSLSIGIGANTVIFSGANTLLLQGLHGVPNSDRIIEIGTSSNGVGFYEFCYPDFLDLREMSTTLQEIAGLKYEIFTLSRGDAGDRAFGLLVSANYFDVLGARAALGRTFLPAEDRELDANPVLVLSHRFWSNQWGADPDVVGSTVYLSRQPYTVVGVMPPDFRSHSAAGNPDVYVPLTQRSSLSPGRNYFEGRRSTWFSVIGLMTPGATFDQVNSEVAAVFQRLAEAHPETNAERTTVLRPYGALPSTMRGYVGLFLGVLMGFAALLLLITCANVAGVFLARANSRQKEIAIQLAIGSSRGQLIRHLLTESLVVFSVGAIGGVSFAHWFLRFVSSLTLPGPFPVSIEVTPDVAALLFALMVAAVTGLVFGLLPAHQALKLSLVSTLKNEGADPHSTGGRLRRVFVAAQVAASLVLLAGAGLLLRALQHAGEIETGFDSEGAYVTFMDLTTEGFTAETGGAFQDEILEYFSALPWVESVALSIDLPLDLSTHGSAVVPAGWETISDRDYLSTRYNAVSPEYFSTLRIGLMEGRVFEVGDRSGEEEVAVISQAFAERAWPGERAVGRRMEMRGETLTVVGVVDDVPNELLNEAPRPLLYRPLAQAYGDESNLVIRSSANHALVARETHNGLRTLDRRLSLSPVIELRRFNEIGILPQRIAGGIAITLGFIALLLATMGVYGVMASAVAQRRREMGVRLALGAESGRVLVTVMAGALRFTLPGVLIGTLLALALGVLLQSLLLGVSPHDPVALVGAVATVGAMVFAGTLIPAHRAASTDPAEALRHE